MTNIKDIFKNFKLVDIIIVIGIIIASIITLL